MRLFAAAICTCALDVGIRSCVVSPRSPKFESRGLEIFDMLDIFLDPPAADKQSLRTTVATMADPTKSLAPPSHQALNLNPRSSFRFDPDLVMKTVYPLANSIGWRVVS